jgi:hypothetical protein
MDTETREAMGRSVDRAWLIRFRIHQNGCFVKATTVEMLTIEGGYSELPGYRTISMSWYRMVHVYMYYLSKDH